jgi:two-component system, cell cycle response regulator
MRLIFKNLNVLRSTLNAISMSFEIKEIIASAGTNLPNLFDFSSFGVFLKDGPALYLYEEESCPAPFAREVMTNMVRVLSMLGEEVPEMDKITVQVEKRKFRPKQAAIEAHGGLKSHLTLPLAVEGEMIGCISLNSEQPNAFDAQDLQFFSVIGYQVSSTLKHFQRFSSIKNIAIYDTLTNLHNRRYFEERFGMEAQKSFYSGASLSLVMMDIDHFKNVNDTFGHTEGDKVLCEISSLLKASVRKKDTVARYGGEEFIVILPEAGLEESSMIAERVRKQVEATRFDVGSTHIHLTVSLGISNFPTHRPRSKEDLIKMADLALYDAKRSGRNKVCIFFPGQR